MTTKQISLPTIGILFLIGAGMWHVPVPAGLPENGWHLLIIFLLTIVGIIRSPAPMSVVALLGASATIVTKVLTLPDVLSGFTSPVIWIVVFAFFIALGFIKTGLSRRIAYFFISKLGNTMLGVSYGLITTELLLAPAVPSVAARGGGIVCPVIRAVLDAFKDQDVDPKALRTTGGFLYKACFQGSVITSAMFVTSMAGNPLAVDLARQFNLHISWSTWALGAIVPGLISLILVPLIMYVCYPPGIKKSPDAPKLAKEALKAMGPLTKNEIMMGVIFVALLVLWIGEAKIGINATTSAMLGVGALMLTGELTWNDALSEKGAWDTMIWFAVLLALSGALGKLGVMAWVGDNIQNMLGGGWNPSVVALILSLIYLYIHYFFASATAHITVFYVIFTGLLIKMSGIAALPAALFLGYMSALCAGLTHYGNAAAPLFYGNNFLTTAQWWRYGFIISVMNLVVWGGIGFVWWWLLGWL